MKKPAKIAKWGERFENAKSKTYKMKSQGSLPINLGGSGYRRMMRLPDGPAMYGCFVSMAMMVHGSGSVDRDGYLTDTGGISGGYYDIEDISLKISMSEELIAKTIEFCSSAKMGWMERGSVVTGCEHEGYHEDTARIPQDIAEVPQDIVVSSNPSLVNPSLVNPSLPKNKDTQPDDFFADQPKDDKPESIDFDKLKDWWNEKANANGLKTKRASFSADDKKKVKARLADAKKLFAIHDLDEMLIEIGKELDCLSDFAKDSSWFKCDWLFHSQDNFKKLLEGNYKRESAPRFKGRPLDQHIGGLIQHDDAPAVKDCPF